MRKYQMKRTRKRALIPTLVGAGALLAGYAVLASPTPAEAHGAFTYPASRTYACFDDATGGTGGGELDPTNPACVDGLDEGGDYACWNRYGHPCPGPDRRAGEC